MDLTLRINQLNWKIIGVFFLMIQRIIPHRRSLPINANSIHLIIPGKIIRNLIIITAMHGMA
jgi:hypothetical protein